MKIALIIAVAIVVCVFVYSWFSPYQSCVRAFISGGLQDNQANLVCAREIYGNK